MTTEICPDPSHALTGPRLRGNTFGTHDTMQILAATLPRSSVCSWKDSAYQRLGLTAVFSPRTAGI